MKDGLRVEELLLAGAAIVAAARRGTELALVGIGWATVDAERAAIELASVLPGSTPPEAGWEPADRDDLLGARASARTVHILPRLAGSVARAADGLRVPDPLTLVLLEPDTEGRLAAFLARNGEGVAAAYVRGSGETTLAGQRSGPAPGPLGPARLLVGSRPSGPSLVVLEPNGRPGGTIRP